MVDMTILKRIKEDTNLDKAFSKVMQKKGLAKLWEFTTVDRDERTAFRKIVQNMTQVEDTFSKGLLAKVRDRHQAMFDEQRQKMVAQDPTYDADAPDDVIERKLNDLIARVNVSPAWKKVYGVMMIRLKQRFATFAENDFPHTPEYAAYVRAQAERDARKLARDMELDREIDEFLELTVAVGTGDAPAANRLSRQLSERHQPKRGKRFKGPDIIKQIKQKFGRKFL